MRATKASYLVQEGIAYHEKLEIADICKMTKFNLIIDQSTDISRSGQVHFGSATGNL